MLNIYNVTKVSKNIQDDIRACHLGTVVHIFDKNSSIYLIELIDNEGRTTEIASLKEEDTSLYWLASTETYIE